MKPMRASATDPSREFRFFYYDPNEGRPEYFKSAEDRDAAAAEAIADYLDEGWSDDVTGIVAGEITQHTIRYDVEMRPKREDFESDEEFEDADSEWNPDWDHKCNYKLAPLSEKSEALLK